MRYNAMRLAKVALLFSSGIAGIARATPPDLLLIDKNGVNQLDSTLHWKRTDLSIGPPGAELSYAHDYSYNYNYSGLNSQEEALDNWSIYLSGSSSGTGGINVVLSDHTVPFSCMSFVCTPVATDGSTLTHSGASYTFTSSQGIVITFSAAISLANALPYNQAIAWATQVKRPDGYVVSLNYQTSTFIYSSTQYKVMRLASVVSGNGYKIGLNYSRSSGLTSLTSDPHLLWGQMSRSISAAAPATVAPALPNHGQQ